MEKFTKISSSLIPIPLKDIDTDMLIPADYLTSTSRVGYGENLFRRLRDNDKNFPLNLEKYQSSKIIIARNNFGCGSSREHAVWAILGYGIRVVISPSFADIFFNNSAKNGLVLIKLSEDVVEKLIEKSTENLYEVTVDLENQKVQTQDGENFDFEFDEFRKECILKGYDDLDYLLSNKDKIEEYKKYRNENLYFSTI